MLGKTQREVLVARLNRAEGQLRGIRRMIQEPRPCIELLQQLAAAESALGRISHSVFKFHVESCIPDGMSKGKAEQQKQLKELIDIFDRHAR